MLQYIRMNYVMLRLVVRLGNVGLRLVVRLGNVGLLCVRLGYVTFGCQIG
jgi:hypothetical protein